MAPRLTGDAAVLLGQLARCRQHISPALTGEAYRNIPGPLVAAGGSGSVYVRPRVMGFVSSRNQMGPPRDNSVRLLFAPSIYPDTRTEKIAVMPS